MEKKKDMYLWYVTLDGKTAMVKATDKYQASREGCRALGVVWRERARDLDIVRIGGKKK